MAVEVLEEMGRDVANDFATLLCRTYARHPSAAMCQETWVAFPGASYHALPVPADGKDELRTQQAKL